MNSLALRLPRAGLVLLALVFLLPSNVRASEPSETQQAVIDANEAFYSAFRNQNMEAMDAIWARSDDVAVIHPGWPGLNGRDEVMESWRLILDGGAPPGIRSVDPAAFVHGDVAFVVCYEAVGDGLLIATNIFVVEDGAWRMVHHQAGPSRGNALVLPGEKI